MRERSGRRRKLYRLRSPRSRARTPSSSQAVQGLEIGLDERAVLGRVAVGVRFEQIEPQPVGLAQQVGGDLGRRALRHVLARTRLALRVEVAAVDRALRVEQPRQDAGLLLREVVAGAPLAQLFFDVLHVPLRPVEPAQQLAARLVVLLDLLELLADPRLLLRHALELVAVTGRQPQLLGQALRQAARALVELRLLLAESRHALAQPGFLTGARTGLLAHRRLRHPQLEDRFVERGAAFATRLLPVRAVARAEVLARLRQVVHGAPRGPP